MVLKIRNDDDKQTGLNLTVLPLPIIQRRIRILKKLNSEFIEKQKIFKKNASQLQ